jgi:SAM-dependent methyltransferase
VGFGPDPLARPDDVPSDHRFQNAHYVRGWEADVLARPERPAPLQAFGDALARCECARVVELGSGPGILAAHLLEQRRDIEQYVLVDFSEPMHDLARARLSAHVDRVVFEVRDLRAPGWSDGLGPADAVVTLQAVHELRHASRIPALYAAVHGVLGPGGRFVMGDLVNGPARDSANCLTVAEHLDRLRVAGFPSPVPVLELARHAVLVADRGA